MGTRRAQRGSKAALLAIVALLAIGVSACARAPVAAPYELGVRLDRQTLTLANGLRVMIHRESRATTALVWVRYHVGGKDDPIGRAGLAHLFEHLMFRGSAHSGGRGHTQWIDESGGTANAATSQDETDYVNEVPVAQLPLALWLEADRMAYPLGGLDEVTFARERLIVGSEHQERDELHPERLVYAAANAAVFGARHPYASPVIGAAPELAATTLNEARLFARRYYRPNNATLVVASPLPADEVKAMIVRWFTTIPPGEPLGVPVGRPPRLLRTIKRTLEVPSRPRVVVAWPIPTEHRDGHEEVKLALLRAEGALRRRLRDDEVALNVDSGVTSLALGAVALIDVQLRDDATKDACGAVVRAVDAALDDVSDALPQEISAWLRDVHTWTLVEAVTPLDTLQGRAERLLHDTEHHGGYDATREDLRAMQSVTGADVVSALDAFLRRPARVEICAQPRRGDP